VNAESRREHAEDRERIRIGLGVQPIT